MVEGLRLARAVALGLAWATGMSVVGALLGPEGKAEAVKWAKSKGWAS